MKFFHDKKAAGKSVIAGIIFALLVFTVVIVTFGNNTKKVENIKPYLTECRLTLGAEKILDDVSFLARKIEDTCYTVQLDQMNDKTRPNDVMEYAANRMAQSWWVTWEGSKSVFDTDGTLRVAGYDCVTLFDLDYNDPKYSQTISADNLSNFLINNIYEPKDMTYNQYLQGTKGNGAWIIMSDITPGKNYAISIFNPHDDSNIQSVIRSINVNAYALVLGKSLSQEWFGVNPDRNTVIMFSDLETAQDMRCHYRGLKE